MSRIHISFPVRELDDSIDFYGRLFGSAPSKLKSDYANFRLDEPPIHLSMVASDHPPAAPGRQHFGVELLDRETLEAWRQRVEVMDLEALEEPEAQCCYAKADKLWLTDPDGHRWEIWVRTGDFDAMGSTTPDERAQNAQPGPEASPTKHPGQSCCS